jgi:pimeloyl-ACP methyl ester carboxylesterase
MKEIGGSGPHAIRRAATVQLNEEIMKEGVAVGSDGVSLNYATSEFQEGKPWIALIIPFGLRVSIARPFFDFFQPQYNIVSWEARLILSPNEEPAPPGAFELQRHTRDFDAVLASCNIRRCVVVGYCSGAGIALGAANRYPHRISDIVLAHGEYALLDEPGCSTQFGREMDGLLTMAHTDEGHLRKIFEKVNEERLDAGEHRPQGIDLPFSKLAFLRRYAQNYQAYKQADFQKLARFVTHRTLLMTGKRDAQANVASTVKIKNAMPNSTLHVDDAADHYGILREDSSTLTTLWNHLCEQRKRYG